MSLAGHQPPPVERGRPPPVPWPEPCPPQNGGTSGARPGTAEQSPAAPASGLAGPSHAAAGCQPLPGQSTTALAPAPSSGGPSGAGRPQTGPVNQPVDNAVLQMLIQQMQQQQQQMISLLQNLGLQPRPAAAPPGLWRDILPTHHHHRHQLGGQWLRLAATPGWPRDFPGRLIFVESVLAKSRTFVRIQREAATRPAASGEWMWPFPLQAGGLP